MKTIAFAIGILCACVSYGSLPHFYGETHAMGGIPMVGVGMRDHKFKQGYDFSVNVCPLNPPESLFVFHARGVYTVYPARKGMYFGGGLGVLNWPETIGVTGSLEGTLGYEWVLSNRSIVFLQANVIAPFKRDQFNFPIWPGLSLGTGF